MTSSGSGSDRPAEPVVRPVGAEPAATPPVEAPDPAPVAETPAPAAASPPPTRPAPPRPRPTPSRASGARGLGLRLESALVRVVLTIGIVAIGVALGAILVSSNVDGWIDGLVVSAVSVLLASIVWSSERR